MLQQARVYRHGLDLLGWAQVSVLLLTTGQLKLTLIWSEQAPEKLQGPEQGLQLRGELQDQTLGLKLDGAWEDSWNFLANKFQIWRKHADRA